MKKTSVIITILILMFIITGCNNENNTTGKTIADSNKKIVVDENIEKIEIIHFHGTNQCYSCITVGQYAEDTINTYFENQLKSGKIQFMHINGELKENQELVQRYEVRSSSLWIGIYYKDNSFHKEENTNVWYKIRDKQDFMSYLKELIEKRLSGDLN